MPRVLTAQSSEPSPRGHHPFPASEPGVAGPQGLVDLLAWVPQRLIEASAESGVHWYYADLAGQLDSLGIAHDADASGMDDANWLPAFTPLAVGSSAFQFARVEEFIDAIGFQPLGIDQTLLVGAPPEQLTLFRATFDASRLESAWEGAGYTRESAADGQSFWTIDTEGEFDIDHPVQRVVFSAFNNLALAGPDLLLCAPTRALLEEALAAADGGAAAAIAEPYFQAALATLPATTVSAVSFSPAGIGFSVGTTEDMAGEYSDLIVQSDAEVGPLPRYSGLVTALGAGAMASEDGGDAGGAMIRMVTSSPADAEQVLAAVEYRWTEGASIRTGQPYTDLMEITNLAVEGNVAAIDFRQVRSPAVWRDMFIARDTLPFFPSPES
jgi:hypothetical protein